MSDDTGDQVPSLFNIRRLTKDFYTLVPNTFLIFSISILFILILYSNKSFEDKPPYDMFCYMKQEDKPTCKKSNNEKVDEAEINCPPIKHLDGTDISTFGLFAFIMNQSYKVTLNATHSVIHLLLKQIQSMRLILLYVLFFILIKTTKEIVKAFFPFNLFGKIKNKDTSILFDFMSIFMSVISFLFTICLLVAIVVYFGYVFYRMATARRHDAKLIPVFIFLILIIPLIAVVFGLNLTIPENGSKPKNKEKDGKYNWVFFLLIALGIPFAATCQTLGYVLISGFLNLFTNAYVDKIIAKKGFKVEESGKDTINQYPPPHKVRGGSGVLPNTASVAAMAGAAIASAVATPSNEVKQPPLPKKSLLNTINNKYKESIFKTKFDPNDKNWYFHKKARRIRKDALWCVGGLTIITTILTMLDSSTTILKFDKAKKILDKTRKILI